jgi:biopolymer transport protein ExbB/TolQ
MKKNMIVVVEIVMALLIAFSSFKAVMFLIGNNKDVKPIKIEQKETKQNNDSFNDKAYIQCLEKTPIKEQHLCIDLVKKKQEVKSKKDKNDKNKGGLFIDCIYYLIILLLAVELFLFFESVSKNLKINYKKIDTISELTIKIPPMLGIAGTIYSLSQFASKSNSVDTIVSLFKANMSSAFGTTLFAIAVYVLNHTAYTYISAKRV